jgi:pyridoxine 5-phosphate synthase
MTALSVNINKIALLRNSRGRDYPNVVGFAQKFYALGVRGITIHPRQDERHVTRQDTLDLGRLVDDLGNIELNIEGYPSEEFLELVERANPTQCTLVPDSPSQLTSDHGWDLTTHLDQVRDTCSRLNSAGIRSAIFLNPGKDQIRIAAKTGTNRIELYTEEYAATYGTKENDQIFRKFKEAAKLAQELGMGVNAGHDLNRVNLAKFLVIDGILEVSIGHALIVESIEKGMDEVIGEYLEICNDEVKEFQTMSGETNWRPAS